jgi:hypothetical protein
MLKVCILATPQHSEGLQVQGQSKLNGQSLLQQTKSKEIKTFGFLSKS